MPAPATRIDGVNVVRQRLLRTDGAGAGLAALRGEQFRPALFNQPSDGSVGQRGANRRGRGQRMQNVAHSAQTYNQDFGHSVLCSNSVLEWSLGSPTMATRPPQAITVSRSGTLASV